jgi:hypothetical protein
MKPAEFAIHAWLAHLSRVSGRRLTWERQPGVEVIRQDGAPIGTMTSLSAVETFLRGFERGIESGSTDVVVSAA